MALTLGWALTRQASKPALTEVVSHGLKSSETIHSLAALLAQY